ncbi:MAG: VOC family protein [Chitinophagales bacterium]|nr:VOC family protein [Bacteroidota bacterium]MCB9044316.1 VOC family protein [Chitinophagales bacterium]
MQKKGIFLWHDLTVENAEKVRDFYSAVVGWTFEPVSQGDYNDYNMIVEDGEDKIVVAGICHKKGSIQNFPSQWLNYVIVESMDESIANCKRLGGNVIDGPKMMGNAKFAIIQDPAGAFMVLMEE